MVGGGWGLPRVLRWRHTRRYPRTACRHITDADSLHIIALGALLHDVADRKYSGSDTANEEAAGAILTAVVRAVQLRGVAASYHPPTHPPPPPPLQGASERVRRGVLAVIAGVSYNSEVGGAVASPEFVRETAVVQDADRLEAVGAIGIARCLTYGGAKKRPLYDADDLDAGKRDALLARTLTKEEYAAHSETAVGHFYAKLLRLRGMMKTASGRAVAEQRHAFMVAFLEQLFGEIAGER